MAKKWKYLKGCEGDFDSAPDWCKQVVREIHTSNLGYEENHNGSQSVGDKIWWPDETSLDNCARLEHGEENGMYGIEIIAQRQLIANDEQDLNDCIGQPYAMISGVNLADICGCKTIHYMPEDDVLSALIKAESMRARGGRVPNNVKIGTTSEGSEVYVNIKVGELYTDGKVHTANLTSKYHREIKPDVWVDAYDVLNAWGVTNPALQHLIKKALQPGLRGHKTLEQDLQEIIDSAIRAKEMEMSK